MLTMKDKYRLTLIKCNDDVDGDYYYCYYFTCLQLYDNIDGASQNIGD